MTYIFANWKMYLDFDETMILTNQLLQDAIPQNMHIAVFPNALAVSEVEKAVRDTGIALGAQHVHWTPKGAYTGATSAELYRKVGCAYALVGHSERRHVFGETNDDVRKQLEACLDVGMIPVLCIGETTEDRQEEKTQYRLKKQLMKALDGAITNGQKVIVAYEPVWAISKAGDGTPCLASDAEDIIGWIKQEIEAYTDQHIPVIYGGSVDAENITSYLSQESIDGVLPGSASTKYESFSALIAAAATV